MSDLAERWDNGGEEEREAIVAVEVDRLLETYGDGCRFGPLLKRLWSTLATKPKEATRGGYVDGTYADWLEAVELIAEIPDNQHRWITQTARGQEAAALVVELLHHALIGQTSRGRFDPPSEERLPPPGIYRVDWREGGSSIAAVGMRADGGRWLAPTNWIRATDDPDWSAIRRLTPLAGLHRELMRDIEERDDTELAQSEDDEAWRTLRCEECGDVEIRSEADGSLVADPCPHYVWDSVGDFIRVSVQLADQEKSE